MRKLKTVLIASLLVVAVTAGVAVAQTKKGPNGGMVVKSDGHPIEFVLNGQDIVFFLGDDDGSPLPTKGMKARATIQDGSRTATVALQAATPNKMIGKLDTPLGAKARVVFSGSLHGHSLTARYVTE